MPVWVIPGRMPQNRIDRLTSKLNDLKAANVDLREYRDSLFNDNGSDPTPDIYPRDGECNFTLAQYISRTYDHIELLAAECLQLGTDIKGGCQIGLDQRQIVRRILDIANGIKNIELVDIEDAVKATKDPNYYVSAERTTAIYSLHAVCIAIENIISPPEDFRH